MNRQETDALLREYMDYLLEHSDAAHPFWNIEIIRQGIANKWNYIDGCMISAVLSLYDYTGDRKYLDFADAFVGDFVQEDGSIRTYRTDEYNLDNINPAKNLFRLYDLTGKEKYRKALDLVRSQLDTMPRTGAGNFWHKEVYPNQVWLDGLYMAQPFYMEYETRYRGMQGCLDCFRQFRNIEKLMRDDVTGLYYHGYDESRQMYWADPETGLSPNFWLRSIGWFTLGITDTKASPLCDYADVCLFAKSEMVSFLDSLVAPMGLINALIVAVGSRDRERTRQTFKDLEDIWSEYGVYQTIEH